MAIELKVFEVWTHTEARIGRRLPYEQVADATGLAVDTLRRLKLSAISRLDLRTLDRLCAFFNCQPGDLLTYVPDEEADEPANED